MATNETQNDTSLLDAVRFYLAIGCLAWYAVLWSIILVGCVSARKRYRSRPRSPTSYESPLSVPGVSILRPLKGLDTNLYDNLESTFLQEYPTYEILFSVADERDPALGVVRSLLDKYPNVNARLIIGNEIVGVNPKVNNLIRPYTQAQHDILWVIDSNVNISPQALARAVDILRKPPKSRSGRRIALVHHVPFVISSTTALGTRVEEAFLNTNHAKMYIALNTLAIDSCVMGKSNLYRRSDLDQLDSSLKPHAETSQRNDGERGLKAFGRFMAEDNMIAAALWHELGLRHDLSCDIAMNVIGEMSLLDYIQRRVRWIRVRKHMVLSATLLEPLTESVFVGALASASTSFLFRFPPWLFLVLHFGLWITVDLDVYASLAGHRPYPGTRIWFWAAWAVRELLAFPIWFFAVMGSAVVWRGKRYQMLRNGEVKLAQTTDSGMNKLLIWLGMRTRKDLENYEPLGQAQT